MNHQANSTAKLHQGGKDYCIDRWSIPMNNSIWNKCILVIICTSENMSICERMIMG